MPRARSAMQEKKKFKVPSKELTGYLKVTLKGGLKEVL